MENKNTKILFLAQVLMSYNTQLYRLLAETHNVLVIHYKHPSVPHISESTKQFRNYEIRVRFSVGLLIRYLKMSPDVVILGDTKRVDYLLVAAAQRFRAKVSCLATDTHDSLPYAKTKRYFKKLACLLCFNKIWVPAETHRIHAQALGFNLNDIYYNLYTAETKRFSKYYYESQKIKKKFSKKFIYIGRYSDEKGVDLLLNAWNRLPHKMGWGLTMVGTGTLPRSVDTSDVEFLNYKQPSQMDNFFDKYTCAIFPSRHEPWCVTLHELCAAGFFIIASSSIPATNFFVRNNENGFLIEPNSISELVTAIYRVINLTPEEFHRSAELSVTLSERLTVDMALTTVVALSGDTRQ